MSSGEPSAEELLKQIKVDDVLLQTVVTLINLGGRRLTVKEEKDPAQAKQAIDAARALLPALPPGGDRLRSRMHSLSSRWST